MGYGTLDYGLLVRMTASKNVHDAVRAYRKAKGDEIHKLPAQVHSIIDWLYQIGLIKIGPGSED